MTECIQGRFAFPSVKSRQVEEEFSGGDISSDGGFLLHNLTCSPITHHWRTNQFRLRLSSLAYVLMESIQRLALYDTKLARA